MPTAAAPRLPLASALVALAIALAACRPPRRGRRRNLGAGEGRTPIAAAREFGARAVGFAFADHDGGVQRPPPLTQRLRRPPGT